MLAPAPNLALAPDTGEDVGMASLYRRGKVWWYAFKGHDDSRVVDSARTGSKSVAAAILASEQHKHALEVGLRLPTMPLLDPLGASYTRSLVIRRDLAACGIKGANWRSFRGTFCTALEVAGVAEDARAKLRRDKGRGSTTLVRWTYSDSAQTTDPLRAEVAKLDRWLAGAFEKAATVRAGSA